MPYSLSLFDDIAASLIKGIKVDFCLDIGAGAGKYGKLVRQYHPKSHLIAVEIESEYIEQFGLASIYDEVKCVSADSLIDPSSELAFDLVVFGDCLEHMRKSLGVDLINFFMYRTKYMLAIFPEGLIQGCWQGHLSEAHISVWSNSDFTPFDHVFIQRIRTDLVVINGYLLKRVEPTVQELLAEHLLCKKGGEWKKT